MFIRLSKLQKWKFRLFPSNFTEINRFYNNFDGTKYLFLFCCCLSCIIHNCIPIVLLQDTTQWHNNSLKLLIRVGFIV